MGKRRERAGRWQFGSLALLVPLALCLIPGAAKAELYGLVIGIDDYLLPANHLDGAVNDAKDIAQSLQHAEAKEVSVLLNDDARKARIVAEWERLVGKAEPGDTFVFSYAGHGGQEPAPPDRHDKTTIESFQLGHFAPSGPGTAERIVDDEVFAWLERLTRRASRSCSSLILAIAGAWNGARALLE